MKIQFFDAVIGSGNGRVNIGINLNAIESFYIDNNYPVITMFSGAKHKLDTNPKEFKSIMLGFPI